MTTTGSRRRRSRESGRCRPGVTFADNGNGTATLAGTPAAGTGGTYPLTITATNGVEPRRHPELHADGERGERRPAITSAACTTFTVGTAGHVHGDDHRAPRPRRSRESGALPAGRHLHRQRQRHRHPRGHPAGGYRRQLPASRSPPPTGSAPSATQSFTLTVDQAPAITSAQPTTFTIGTAGTFTVTDHRRPDAGAHARPGRCPRASPSPTTATARPPSPAPRRRVATAATPSRSPPPTGSAPDATQSFTLTVDQAPAITSAGCTTFTAGTRGHVHRARPPASRPRRLTETGALPSGVTFIDNGNGTATLAGTPAAGTGGTYPLTITAGNGAPPPPRRASR